MDKRLAKRHKRQVSRAKEWVSLSEPDVRTPEQLKAARDSSRPAGGSRNGAHANNSTPSLNHHARPVADTTVKGEA